jgi:hypothetical protein
MGKSYQVVKWAEKTGNRLSIFTSRRELYGQYEGWCTERELKYLVLPAFQHDCETMQEDHRIKSQINELYNSGISGAEIHDQSEQYFGRSLPCQLDGQCQYMENREFDPNEYDVLIGHYLQAHNSDYLEDRYVAIDEFPGDAYFFEPTHNEATRAVSNYLKTEDTLPFDNWKDLHQRHTDDQYENAVSEWKKEFGFYSYRDTRATPQRSPDFHAHAPLLVHADLEFELLENDWEYAKLGSGRIAVRTPEDEWTVLIPPRFYLAESVIALDGTPAVTKWRLTLGETRIAHEEVLNSDREKREYLRNMLGIRIKQTNAGTKPYQSGNYIDSESDTVLLSGICEREGVRPTVITSKQAKKKYESLKVDECIEKTENYGNLRGSNQFAEVSVGAIIGSPHPPEGEAIKRWGAMDQEAISRNKDENDNKMKGKNIDFGPLGNTLFQDVVTDEVLQAIMRFGRKPTESESGATVYVHTSRLPDWVNVEKRLEVKTRSDGMKQVVTTVRESERWPDGEWTNNEIAEKISIKSGQVKNLMKKLEQGGYVSHRRGGQGNPYHWSNECLEEFSKHGHIE